MFQANIWSLQTFIIRDFVALSSMTSGTRTRSRSRSLETPQGSRPKTSESSFENLIRRSLCDDGWSSTAIENTALKSNRIKKKGWPSRQLLSRLAYRWGEQSRYCRNIGITATSWRTQRLIRNEGASRSCPSSRRPFSITWKSGKTRLFSRGPNSSGTNLEEVFAWRL